VIFIKSCPKCRGDVYPEESKNVVELVCLQCGRREYLVPEYDFSAVQSDSPHRAGRGGA
jgi:hypothetical protein